MKQINKRVRTRFARDVEFKVKAAAPGAGQTAELEQLKNRLLGQLQEEAADAEQTALLQRAANDAAALAWATQYPVLLFPVLLEEKAQAALLQLERQNEVRQRSRHFVLQAA